MLRDLKQLLHLAAYKPIEIERLLDGDEPAFVQFDSVLGYLLKDYVFRDGVNDTLSEYCYEPNGGHRKVINHADKPCRINTYGNSFTQCAQVSDGETWQETLAAHFREPIRNFGVGGYGVYQAYNTAMRAEKNQDLAADYIVLNVWDDDHYRNIDAARWIRVAWMCRDLPRGEDADAYPVHGFPWAHLRYDLDKKDFIELPGACQSADDLRKLADQNFYYELFKDDEVAQLYCLSEGGDAPTEKAQALAAEFGLSVDLDNPETRAADAQKIRTAYALRSTMWIVDTLGKWCEDKGRNLMVLLSYDVPSVKTMIEDNTRFDQEFVDYLDQNGVTYVDCLQKAADDFTDFKIDIDDWLMRYYIGRAGAQVFGHYKPAGNFWFAKAIRQELVDWMDPKPPAYQ